MTERRIEGLKFLRMGAGIIVQNHNEQILMGRRASKTGFGLWCLPGGKNEQVDRDIVKTSVRELDEEAGINRIAIIGVISVDDSNVMTRKYLNFGVWGVTDQEPRIINPMEIDRWKWFSVNALPKANKIFKPSLTTLQCFFQRQIQINR